MARIPKARFSRPDVLPFNVFMRLGRDHFILVGRKGNSSTIHRLKAFEAEFVSWFYVARGDFPLHLSGTLRDAVAARNGADVLSALGPALDAVNELVRTGNFEPVAWDATRELAGLVVESALRNPSTAALMSSLQGLGEPWIRHSIAVAVMAVLLARADGASDDDMLDVAAAGLLHDIGLIRLSTDITTTPPHLLSPVDLALYQRHPADGAALLRACPAASPEVARMVEESHENESGTGYPARLSPASLSRWSPALALAERFCELTVGDGMHRDLLTTAAALNTVAGGDHSPGLVKILENLIASPRS